MSETHEYDVVVIGAGPVGENVAQYAIEGTDLTAALVEGELYGGECSYWACIPSKALLRPIAVADTTAHLQGVATAEVEPEGLLARRDFWVGGRDDTGQVRWAEGLGITAVRGHARLVGEREVEVTGEGGPHRLRARHAVVLATGSEPVVPPPLADVHPWGSRDATAVTEVPGRLVVVVGGGVVAVEAATWMAALGSEVTVLVRGETLLAGQEPFAGSVVAQALQAKGVDVRFSTSATGCRRPDARNTGVGRVHGGPVTVVTDDGEVEADEVLVATGRHPRLGDVGLDAVGLTPDDVLEGRLPEWLHAVGDASGEAPLTHWGKYRARVLGDAIAAAATGRGPLPVPDGAPVPQVVYTDPAGGAGRDDRGGGTRGRVRRRGGGGPLRAGRRGRPAARRRPRSGETRRRPEGRAGPWSNLRRDGRRPAAARRDDRDHRAGAGPPAAARGAELPRRHRGVAAPARGPAGRPAAPLTEVSR